MAESVGNVYGTALFELCVEQNCLETVFEELTAVKDLISLEENAPYMRFLSAVQISGEEKCKSLESVFGGKISQLTLDFFLSYFPKGKIFPFV
jgi:F-type H+-transporting ATPase subunit delta